MSIAVMYHALSAQPGDDAGADPHYTIGLAPFREHLAACLRLCGGAVSAREWLAGRDGVVVTFDDGHASNHRLGLPALLAAGVRADFFVNPAQVGTAGFATWSELREMSDAGMSIQSHGLDHRTYLTALPPARLRADLRRARLEIEQHVGCPVSLLAPPGGRAPAGLPRIAGEVGYTHVWGSQPAPLRRGDRGNFGSCRGVRMLGRFAITADFDLATFESLLRGGPARTRAQVRHAILAMAKRTLGDGLYERVRETLLGSSSATPAGHAEH
jgi:peptidoglycan/xylan/chitin deacetylase (PgdA/CDA1 family)